MKYSTVAFAIALASSSTLSGQAFAHRSHLTGSQESGETPAGFGTNAKVALLWHWSEGAIRSVGVSKVTRGDKGVICVTPKVALDADNIYPIVSFSPEESNTLAGFAGSRNQAELCNGDKDIEVDTYQSNGKSASPSDNVGFYLIIE